MAVTNADLIDLVRTTLKDLPKGEYETMWDLQRYEFAAMYNEKRRQIDGGTSIERNVVLDKTGRARYTRLYATEDPSVQNVQQKINVPWCQFRNDMSWDKLEILRNRNSAKGYINLMQSRRNECLWDLVELFESKGWVSPESATDTLNPYGIPYYLNMLDAGSTTGGFNGQTIRYTNGTTGTICAGLDAASESKWRNYADTYAKVDNSLLRKLRKACLQTNFVAPPGVRETGSGGRSASTRLYAGLDEITELQDLADKRDDATMAKDLAGRALAENEGVITFNRIPVVYVPSLNSASYAPIYAVDWEKFIPLVQDGYWMVESEPMMDRLQPSVVTVYIDGCHQNLCINRRSAGFVMHNPIPA